jgi:2-pyrone-4,6-dicarboxylate lactonase
MDPNDKRPTFHPSPSAPRVRLPPGACDAHCHVFGPTSAFPYAENRTYTPPHEAPKEKLFALHDLLGIERCVIVQAGCHGHDNRAVGDAIAAKGGRYRGVALLPTDVPDAKLRELDAAGFRGVRFNFMRHLGAGPPLAEVIGLVARLADLGWHLQLHMEADLIGELTRCD